MNHRDTLAESLTSLYRFQFNIDPPEEPPAWPPDLFAFCAAALRRSGAYTCFPNLKWGKIRRDGKQLGAAWRKQMRNCLPESAPSGVVTSWKEFWSICRNAESPNELSALRHSEPAVKELLLMLTASDECAAGFGVPHVWRMNDANIQSPETVRDIDCGGDKAHLKLEPGVQGSTLGDSLRASVGRVLPKMHTPQVGLTMRSFSHHLSYTESDEVQPRWFSVPGQRGDVTNNHHLNLLVIPWPYEVRPSQIVESRSSPGKGKETARFFRYVAEDNRTFPSNAADLVVGLCEEATKKLGTLDGVVLPELALSESEYLVLRDRVLSLGLLLVCGVCMPLAGGRPAENRLCIDIPISPYHAVHLRQKKHHRWKLEESQISKYGLGAKLNPNFTYWEDIPIDDRRLLFVVLRPWLVTCPMICEDLARQDPAGELVRGVGPNLLIALLMDGPQIDSRWASRYAMAFADDPGCSVLSLTSLGMAKLSRSTNAKDRSRVIALWKDAKSSAAKELELPAGADALVLTLTVKYETEVTADGRDDGEHSAYPILTGIHPITRGSDQPRPSSPITSPVLISPQDSATLGRIAEKIEKLLRDFPDRRGCVERPFLLDELRHVVSRRIGYEMWAMANGQSSAKQTEGGAFEDMPSPEEVKTAELILRWAETNRWP